MRLLRISLRNYRGVGDRTVEFAPEGVTIVEGPNEIGKSSMAEAIDRIIEDLDSTAKQRVLATKPVDHDAGPEVAIAAECGPYAFLYKKRFLRDRVTELEISKPRPENRTGREAHDRVLAILSETVDMPLWKALRMQQGDAVSQAALLDQTSLSAALDRSAGELPVGEEEVSLFALAHEEYLRYWTETGRRKAAVVEMERAIQGATDEIARIEAAIRSIEDDVEASVRLDGEEQGLVDREAELRTRLDEHVARVEVLAKLEASVETIEAKAAAARLAATEAARLQKARQDAALAVDEAQATQEDLLHEAEEAGPESQAAKDRAEGAEAAVADARRARDTARKEADDLRARLSHLRDSADLADLVDRRKRVTEAIAELETAVTSATSPVDAELLAAIRDQHQTVRLARARLEATQPVVTVEARTPLVVNIDGSDIDLPADGQLERRIQKSMSLRVGGMATIAVAVGASRDVPGSKVDAATTELEALLRRAGATDLAEAERLHKAREDAGRTVTEQRRILKESLGELTVDALEDRVATLRARIGAGRKGATGKKGDEDAARRAVDRAEEVLRLKEQLVIAAETEWQAATARQGALEVARSEKNTELRLAGEELERRTAVLVSERETLPDAVLTESAQRTEAAAADLDVELADARAGLATQGPQEARQLLANAQQALERVETETRQVQDQRLEVRTRLRDHGEDGLAEDLQEAIAAKDALEVELRRYQAQANARKLLFDTLREERERSRRSYVAPLRREIESLGKVVFGPDFAVELDDLSLAVLSRTLDGRTIPFKSLSIGAQEQIALISRLACAMIVAPDGGVPVIVDDALGNSDPQRLEAMGAVLALAGRQSQIIVLTCQPDRYEHVGGAKVVRLS